MAISSIFISPVVSLGKNPKSMVSKVVAAVLITVTVPDDIVEPSSLNSKVTLVLEFLRTYSSTLYHCPLLSVEDALPLEANTAEEFT